MAETFTAHSLYGRMNAIGEAATYGQLVGSEGWGRHLSLLPSNMHQGIIVYMGLGLCTGRFLTAIFKNDMMGAVGSADDVNKSMIWDYCNFLYNAAPGSAYGSAERFDAWQKSGGIVGQAATASEAE
jgi:hypothetical protein